MDGGWDNSDKSIRVLFESEPAFRASKGMGVGKQTIKKFLNSDWKEWEIQEALAQLDEKGVSNRLNTDTKRRPK